MSASRPLLWVSILAFASSLTACHSGRSKAPTTRSSVVHASSSGAVTKKLPATKPSTYAEAEELKEMLTIIAADEMEGRGLNTVGINRAADYIEQQFKDAGLKPLPTLDGYFQPFSVMTDAKLGDSSYLTLGDQKLEAKKDFMPLGLTGSGSFSGPIAFVGYSISSTKHNYDDYAAIDVKGKVALCVRYEPENEKGESYWTDDGGNSPDATFNAKAKAAEEHGAVALIICNAESANDRLPPRFMAMGGGEAGIPVIQITRAAAQNLMKQAGQPDLDDLQKKIDKGPRPNSFLLTGISASGNIDITRLRKMTKNVVGYLPGKGSHKNEYIVVGAHYDHVGRGEMGAIGRSRDIFNGADDNGSGTVAVMALARRLAEAGGLSRSVLFVCFSGEERGLLGSQYFVNHPPVQLSMIVAMLNLDMVGRMKNNVMLVAGTGTADAFEQLVEQSDAKIPVILKTADVTLGAKGGMGPSDHEAFALKKIPVLFLTTGMHPDYHRPSDDVQKINFVGLAQAVDLSANIVHRLAKMPRQQYVDKYDKSGGAKSGITSNVQLGIMPDYAGDSSEPGVRVAGTMPDTAASAAGIREGDVIIAIAGEKVKSLGDYMTILSKHKPGDKVEIDVMRDNQKVTLEATLRERKG